MTTRTVFFKTPDGSQPDPDHVSSPISWTVAENMAHQYNTNPDALKILTATGNMTLHGFSIEAAHLRNLLDGNDNEGNHVQDPAQKIFLMFGVREQDLGQAAENQYFTLIATAVNEQDDIMHHVVYNHMSPCPDDCPNNVSA